MQNWIDEIILTNGELKKMSAIISAAW